MAAVKQVARREFENLAAAALPRYVRCTNCDIPMHKDGHEKPLWCIIDACPKTRLKSQPVQEVLT